MSLICTFLFTKPIHGIITIPANNFPFSYYGSFSYVYTTLDIGTLKMKTMYICSMILYSKQITVYFFQRTWTGSTRELTLGRLVSADWFQLEQVTKIQIYKANQEPFTNCGCWVEVPSAVELLQHSFHFP